jgi:hypothetical protein
VKWIPDPTGRFPVRPYYELNELETECERIITGFLERRYGQIIIPVPTDALRVLIESEPAGLDVHADLSQEGEEIHGLTEFVPGCKPRVSIARELTTQSWRAHRGRTTLTHEYAHLHWHGPLFERYRPAGERHKCARGKLLPGSGEADWMEWQAGYISGALLMLRSRMQLLVEAFRREHRAATVINTSAVEGRLLIGRVSEIFDVSGEAAALRLLQLGHLAV